MGIDLDLIKHRYWISKKYTWFSLHYFYTSFIHDFFCLSPFQITEIVGYISFKSVDRFNSIKPFAYFISILFYSNFQDQTRMYDSIRLGTVPLVNSVLLGINCSQEPTNDKTSVDCIESSDEIKIDFWLDLKNTRKKILCIFTIIFWRYYYTLLVF